MEPAAVLGDLARAIASADGPDLPSRLCSACRAMLGGDGASLALHEGSGSLLLVATSDATSARLLELQETLGEGPSVDALAGEAPARGSLVEQQDRWPVLADAVSRDLADDIASVVALPMRAADEPVGVLTLWLRDGRDVRLPEDEAQLVADATGVALVHHVTDKPSPDGPWQARAVVHQATGMVVAQMRLPVGDALALLRAQAFVLGRDLVDVAQAVVDREIVVGEDRQ